MKAEKYLESIGLENIIGDEFFNDDDKSWYKLPELMEAYHQDQVKNLSLYGVGYSVAEDCEMEYYSKMIKSENGMGDSMVSGYRPKQS
jgi:hypothetical protein